MAKGFVLAATHSGAGKTTITLALLKALKDEGFDVQACKVGPDFIDPQFHEIVTQKPSYQLDSCLMGDEGVKAQFQQLLQHPGASDLPKNPAKEKVLVIEGVMGLYDGLGSRKENGSTAWIARLLNVPVILIIDGAGMSTSAAAMVQGYRDYDPSVSLAGVIINRISSDKHYQLLKKPIERDLGVPCLGWMAKDEKLHLSSRHLGLVPAAEVDAAMETIQRASDSARKNIQLPKVLEVAAELEEKEADHQAFSSKNQPPFQIGIAKDQAFHFYYPANLDWLREQGFQLMPVSPLKDETLPETLDALYIGGGFPEMFGEALEANHSFRNSLLAKAEAGLPIYGECGGFQYLCESLTDFQGKTWQMAGVLPGKARMTERLQRFGYGNIRTDTKTGFFTKEIQASGHEFHRGVVDSEANQVIHVTKMQGPEDPSQPRQWSCGLTRHHTFGAFPHVFFPSNPEYVMEWLKKIKQWQPLTVQKGSEA
ncbi:hydrogenobyrinic acid a,c-diamide synthase (glutamine-hydrolysing) /cobyrinate a,c-diamide synthase [Tindallia magadiensis]|uniref:Cobyrinate a,c-diamide synthase n=1 Tax=Tindallia magadiensis TaxID=69895 RepID=A0A1I3HVR2_9FIRM|nr:cobyrinate a,c-diamide synthase [Tindallia magadiensis]SFI39650.1 hydrogenobyrinic acid a,c-diamide synthase (glutamine-hydrolysing) /cobyrinate a,c-diamide synthase [Tindallia magadiensis]